MSILHSTAAWAIPMMVLFICCYGFIKGINVYDTFIDGAKSGFQTAINIIPYLVAMMVTISILRSSGTLDLIVNALKPLLELCRIPEEVFPLLLLRPLSGSGSMAYVNSLFASHGPDSLIGKMASTVMGSSETTFYVIAVYLGAIGVKDSRYALPLGLFADLVGFVAAVFICNLLF